MSSSAETIRRQLAGGATINMPGVYDAMSARLAAQAGFEVLFVSGYSVSAARLGAPDFGYLTQTEVTDTARGVCTNVDIPVIVDADTGYGNPLNCIRTAELLHGAGAAGIFLEDQVWPKKCGHFAGKRVVERDDWLAKLKAVLDQKDRGIDLFVVARTDALSTRGIEEAILRAQRARDLGVDAVFVEAPRSVEDLQRVAAEVGGVVKVANMIEGGLTPLLSDAELHELGFDLIVTPLSALFAAAKAIQEVLELLRKEGTLRDHRDRLVSFQGFESVVDLPGHRALEDRYGEQGGG
ncbi:MAG: isocitrate lyase/PEP mutase family protein [Actinomycetota bacterium]